MPWWAYALRLTGLGWYVAACVVMGVVGGVFLDRWLDTRIVFTLVGTVLGSVLASWGIYKMVLPIVYGAKQQEASRKRSSRKRRHR
jgi:F0F1-type ATP synthase assembly protein I